MNRLDIAACRAARPYTNKEYIGRFLWSMVSPLFFMSPRVFFGWRSMILRIFGAKVGRNVHIYPSAKIYLPWNLAIGDDSSIGEWALIYNLGFINIGEQVTISHRAHLCAGTHDYVVTSLPLIRAQIKIGSQSWICSDAFIGPGTSIGIGAIVGAGSVVTGNVEDWQIVSGNPATFIKIRLLK
jgi:putative colanic acid biosynthesis acetyltransferase WcaF